MQFDAYNQKNEEASKPAELRVHPGTNQATVTAGALQQYFTRYGGVVDEVTYHTNVEKSILAFDLQAEQGDTFSLIRRESGSTGALSVGGIFVKAFGFEPSELDESHAIALEKHEETGYVVADLAPVVEDALDAEHCSECGKRCATEAALKSHVTKMHDGVPAKLKDGEYDDVADVDAPEGDDSWQDLNEKARADGGER